MHLNGRDTVTKAETEAEKDTSCTCWFTLQLATIATTGPGGSQELDLGPPDVCRSLDTWADLHCFPSGIVREHALEVEQRRLKLVSTWDVSMVGSS